LDGANANRSVISLQQRPTSGARRVSTRRMSAARSINAARSRSASGSRPIAVEEAVAN